MIMVADSVPGLERWIGTLGLMDSAKLLVTRVVVAFLLHAGRMSCLRAAGEGLGPIATTRGPLPSEKDLPCREAETSRPVVLLICKDKSPAVAVSVSPDSAAVGFVPPAD